MQTEQKINKPTIKMYTKMPDVDFLHQQPTKSTEQQKKKYKCFSTSRLKRFFFLLKWTGALKHYYVCDLKFFDEKL